MTLKQVVAYLNESDIALFDSIAGKQGVSRSKLAATILLDFLMKSQDQVPLSEKVKELERRIEKLEQK